MLGIWDAGLAAFRKLFGAFSLPEPAGTSEPFRPKLTKDGTSAGQQLSVLNVGLGGSVDGHEVKASVGTADVRIHNEWRTGGYHMGSQESK